MRGSRRSASGAEIGDLPTVCERPSKGVCPHSFHSAHEVTLDVENVLNLEAAKPSKSFSGVKALEGVSFDLRKGERHALVGENGFLFNPQGKG